MQNQLEKKESPVSVLLKGALIGSLVFIAGVILYLMTDHFAWIIGGIVGDLVFVVPAALKFTRMVREQGNASG